MSRWRTYLLRLRYRVPSCRVQSCQAPRPAPSRSWRLWTLYLDPPFNSNRSYNVIFSRDPGEGYDSDASAQIQAFTDTWHWTRSRTSSTSGTRWLQRTALGLTAESALNRCTPRAKRVPQHRHARLQALYRLEISIVIPVDPEHRCLPR